jgi:hypothetical protein
MESNVGNGVKDICLRYSVQCTAVYLDCVIAEKKLLELYNSVK